MSANTNPTAIETALRRMITAWEEHAADQEFALSAFKSKLKPSFDSRTELAAAERTAQAERATRDNADQVSRAALKQVVSSVKGHPDFGDDSALYADMGHVRASDRKSGLPRGTRGSDSSATTLPQAA